MVRRAARAYEWRMRAVRIVILVLAASGAACAGVTNSLTAVNVQGCVRKNCGEHEAVAYQACEASCHQQYGH